MAVEEQNWFDRLYENPAFHLGLGLLGADNPGQGLSQGLLSYGGAQKYLTAQEERKRKAEQERIQEEARTRYLERVPEEQRDLAVAAPDEYFSAAAKAVTPDYTKEWNNARLLYPNDPVRQQQYVERVTTMSKAPVVNVATNLPPLEDAYDKKRGGHFADTINKLDDSAISAQQRLTQLDRMDAALSNPDVYTGAAGESINSLKKLAQSVGLDVSGVADAELVQTIGNQFAMELRNPSGGAGLPGATSDRDLAFLQSIPPGLGKTPAGNKLAIQWQKRVQQRNIEVAQLARDYEARRGRLDGGFYTELAQWSAQNPLFTEQDFEALRSIEQQVPNRPPTAGTPLAPGEAQDLDTLLEKYR